MSSVHILQQFDQHQLFRLFIDGRYQKKYNGWRGYENQESGSTQGMLNGYAYMLDNFNLSNGISCHYIRNLHHTCLFNVYATLNESSPGDLRCLRTGYKFFAERTSIEFLKELFEVRRKDNAILVHTKGFQKPARELNILDLYKALQKKKRMQFNPWYPDLPTTIKDHLDQKGTLQQYYEAKHYVQMKFAEKMEAHVNAFNETIACGVNHEDKIDLFAKFIRDLEIIHPFPDGNCRTFALLLNHLLLFHNFPPAILENPNLDGTYSYAEYANEIRKGIEHTKLLLENPDIALFDYSIKSASHEDMDAFSTMARELTDRIQNFRDDTFIAPQLAEGLVQQTAENKKAPVFSSREENIYLTPDILQRISDGKWINYDPDMRFKGIASSQLIKPGFLRFCSELDDWRKNNINIEQRFLHLFQLGVSALVVDREEYAGLFSKPILVVDDVMRVLRKTAIAVRQEVAPKTVAVGGTVGKTGFKFQLKHCLNSMTQAHAVLNSGNIKIPILYSLCSLKENDQVEIVEVSGAARYSVGAERAKIVNPDICFFTEISPNHMDVHKTVDNLVSAKASLVEGLTDNGVCIVNKETEYYQKLVLAIKRIKNVPIYTYGADDSDAKILNVSFDNEKFLWMIEADIDGVIVHYSLPLIQNHAPVQSLGVLLTVKLLGYDVRKAADSYNTLKPFPFHTMGRLFSIQMENKSILYYDQSYRGAIQGMRSAFKDLQRIATKGRKIAVVGGSNMEIDDEWTNIQHTEIAELINGSGIDRLYTVGPYMDYVYNNLSDKSVLIKHREKPEELVEDIRNDLEDGDLLFIMGSAYLYLGEKLGSKVLQFGKTLRLR